MQKNRRPELLAPAGSMESLQAAIRCGADAVYVGARQFSARASAENFDDIALKEAAKLCHLSDVKLYLAVNTLVFDDEFPALDHLIEVMADAGVDACIVQDFGVAAYLKRRIPTMPLHASTQMTIHTVGGLEMAKKMGFCRAVLARELSCDKIAELCKAADALGMEIEVFVHGAHCLSVSGQCWMSAGMGGRSANRGRCAQPCRLPFTADPKIKDAHALSLKDMCLVSHVDELCEIGVSSLKIEGRMKRPEYAAAAVTAYRTALDGGKPNISELQSVFSRSGFTDGYFTNQRKAMFGMRGKEDVLAAQDVLNDLRKYYQKPRKIVCLNAKFTLFPNEPSSLRVTDAEGNSRTVTGAVPQTAKNRPTDLEQLRKQFEKLGDTIYSCGEVSAETDGKTMLPASELNALRREAVAAMDDFRIEKYTPHHQTVPVIENIVSSKKSDLTAKIRLQIRSLKQLDRLDDLTNEIEYLLIPLNLVSQYMATKQSFPPERCIVIPPRFIMDETDIIHMLKSAKNNGFTRIFCNHLGSAALGEKIGMQLHGGLGLHYSNSWCSSDFPFANCEDAVVSPEMKNNITGNSAFGRMRLGTFAYGKLPFMLTRNCPIQAQIGCAKCEHVLHDRMGKNLFVDCTRYEDKPDYSEIFNSIPIWLADKQNLLRNASFILLQMSDEEPEEVRDIVKSFLSNGQLYRPNEYCRGLHIEHLT